MYCILDIYCRDQVKKTDAYTDSNIRKFIKVQKNLILTRQLSEIRFVFILFIHTVNLFQTLVCETKSCGV